MSNVGQIKRFARVRDVERQVAAISVASAMTKVSDAETQMLRLEQLSHAIAVPAGLRAGDELASSGEFVARILAGRIATTVERDRQTIAAETARQHFGAADARAEIAHRHVVTAEQANAKSAERSAALKTPMQRPKPCR